MRKTIFCLIAAVIIVLGALSPALTIAEAQTPPPPRQPARQEPCLPGQPCEDENGERFVIPTEETQAEPNAIGDSDDFGYTLTSASYSWIDATGGTNTGINSYDDITAAISLPFAFPFYENSYSQLYITGAGYVTFDDLGWVGYGDDIPDESEPNNFISVLSRYQYYSGSAVYYRNFGTHFVIQWNNIKDGNGGAYTFEAVLYPTGNIKFQYKTLPDPSQGYWCSTAGIENAAGTDGLVFWNYCDWPTTASTAVLFTKPGPSARVAASPLYLGGFTYSLEVDDFIFTLANSGDIGADTYDMVVTTAPLAGGWSVELFDAGTDLPLSDTDADGMIDSGSLAQGESKDVLVRVSAPAGLTLGSAIKTYVDVSSSLNPAKTKTVTIDSTVPAAFAQTYRVEDGGMLWTDLNWPVKQVEANVVSDSWNVREPAIIETPEHNFVQVWTDYDWNGANSDGWVLRYAVTNRFGLTIKEPTLLSPFYDVAGYDTGQRGTSLAVAPDGKVGVVWYTSLRDPAGLENYNIWFAILNPSGSLAYGPVNLTNNDAWGSWQAGNIVQLYDPDISASTDNRFFISWEKMNQSADTYDIFYTIRQSSGAVVVPVTAMTASVSGTHYFPTAQIALSGNRFFVTYWYIHPSGQYYVRELLYRVFDSSGGTLTPPSTLDFYAETAVQLSGGNILLANTDEYEDEIRYQIRNGTSYGFVSESGLSHPSGKVGYRTLAVTKDANNRGILTWSDTNHRYLYYAYVSGTNGAVLTNPVIFHRSDEINLSQNGSGATTNSWSPAAGIDLVGAFSSGLYGGAPGGLAMLTLQYSNIGAGTAEFPELTLTLPAGLTYVGDSSGITPDLVGNTVVWQLAELAYGSASEFTVYLAVDGAVPVPSFLDLSLELSSENMDANPADNLDTAQVLVGLQSFIPIVHR
ncbi:MAG TPA: hypothetical protein PLF02_06575 [Anaerolineaceae bacterium]|nr:hypothetical protein [Anaerolineaceae bacterium]